MAGHSHWANIARAKSVVDKKRGKLFGKLSRAIIVAARTGGADPAMNLRLRYAIDKARKASMPKDNIERAVKKGAGETDGENYEELLYEGYGPGGTAILCDILTENRNRTASEVRKIFEIHGGNLGTTNCVAWMFDLKGVLRVPAENVEEDRLFEVALEAGAEDVRRDGEFFEVHTPPEIFQQVCDAFEEAKVPTDSAETTRVPQNTVDLDGDDARKLLKLLDGLEDQDDIQTVTANFNISDELMAEVGAE
ncbi:YebC/PmpR family DNA-binding transcriptional regulator [Stratiformator vulcanicus]|uniref:Probable transcriptional regulatory protein Pan189_32830 n=1 Tax=Stratiformator vulcanicus TaxID=2527980 RepID=A0A517R4T3_9PLAN|nr:YebC/PmpR family DNA-binding transcriptional regulator [Stratiformator vulcanicus]QDT38884.1 putative transcriptional regulatory protein [Stratiformator vulcanicus]